MAFPFYLFGRVGMLSCKNGTFLKAWHFYAINVIISKEEKREKKLLLLLENSKNVKMVILGQKLTKLEKLSDQLGLRKHDKKFGFSGQ